MHFHFEPKRNNKRSSNSLPKPPPTAAKLQYSSERGIANRIDTDGVCDTKTGNLRALCSGLKNTFLEADCTDCTEISGYFRGIKKNRVICLIRV